MTYPEMVHYMAELVKDVGEVADVVINLPKVKISLDVC